MVTEDYVSLEIAKMLYEDNFNGLIRAFYKNGEVETLFGFHTPDELNDGTYAAPTIQMAMKWLREVRHLTVIIRTGRKSEDLCGHRFWFSVEDDDMNELTDKDHQYNYCADTYEDACNDAIKYCLINLI